MSDFTSEVFMAGSGFALFRGGEIATMDPAGKRPILAYKKWFENHADWFLDPIDTQGMELLLQLLGTYGNPERVRQIVRTDPLTATFTPESIQNWYTKYTMFDPTMGMYDPEEATNYFRQRMLKRLNVVTIHLEERVIRKRKK
ncbi:MAG: hypothetical protein EOP83_07835 [Verrucomicrobiaceae bacterium]|nr:MAG: hypothetical protein EOP83_07835 [Verrucomicrobiaceae bacterium]